LADIEFEQPRPPCVEGDLSPSFGAAIVVSGGCS
jgi:hypothetical protein